MTTYYVLHASPVGELLLVCNGAAITALHIAAGKYVPVIQPDWACDGRQAVLRQARRELDGYFAGKLRRFTVALAPRGTDFQKRAWTALSGIPYGETRTYRQQAHAIGRPTAVRAVGGANARNRIGIIVPCHRVIGADGSLTGYAGGLCHKAFLLQLEGAL
ncbi:MAG: methylated-DNA--[protein]-cysteine S-methyltransferase [Betaproteobacteria bacterium]|nr:methylated-DNA--[protein]-cysteine S-methyltransferase [Betaproteobacteria bacterium]